MNGFNIFIASFIGGMVTFLVTMGFEADDEVWTPGSNGCYAHSHTHRSIAFNDYTTNETLCPVKD